jgi:hypothetical protein
MLFAFLILIVLPDIPQRPAFTHSADDSVWSWPSLDECRRFPDHDTASRGFRAADARLDALKADPYASLNDLDRASELLTVWRLLENCTDTKCSEAYRRESLYLLKRALGVAYWYGVIPNP